MRRLAALIVLAAVSMPGTAGATDWYLTSESQSGNSVTFIDRDSIRPAGEGIRRVNLYVVRRETSDDGTASLDALMEFDCRTPRRRYVRITGYDERLARVRTEEGTLRWGEIAPGTQDRISLTFVCSGGTDVAGAIPHGSAYPFAAGRARLARNAGK